jgi:Flp pilus assembly protein TadG
VTRRLREEHGQVTAMWAVFAVALLALGGLVYDGGQILTARREANNLARQAARAGAQQLDENSVRAGSPTLDPGAADAAARAYLARRGLAPAAVIVAGSTVTVTTEITQPTPLLALVGIDARTVTSTASARSARGVSAEGH